jgi:hypothetical protein
MGLLSPLMNFEMDCSTPQMAGSGKENNGLLAFVNHQDSLLLVSHSKMTQP